MASLRQIRRRMKSVENIHEITAAMEMIAAFRCKKAEGRFSRSRAYLAELEKLVSKISSGTGEVKDALFAKREIKNKALVVMTGDKGLCGAYNANILRAALGWQKEQTAQTAFIPVGKVGAEFLRKRKAQVLASYPDKSAADLAMAQKLMAQLKELYLSGQVDEIAVLYMSFRVGGTGRIQIAPLLPFSWLTEKKAEGGTPDDYLVEPDRETLYLALLKKYTEGKMLLLLLESLTSEFAARMVSMKQATENGEEVLDDLKLLKNKTRQATITRELSEIVAGASILV